MRSNDKMKNEAMKCLSRWMMTATLTFAMKGLYAQTVVPDPMPVDAAVMVAAKAAISQGDPLYKAALDKLVKRARTGTHVQTGECDG